MRALYSRYLPLVRGQVERVLRAPAGVDAVVQAVFLRYVAQRHDASTHHDPIAHLYRLSTHLAVQALRTPRRRRTGPIAAAPAASLPGIPSYEAPPPPEVLTALRGASQQDAELLALFYLAEMSHAEIGETLGIPPDVVAERLDAWARSEAADGA